MALGSLLGAVVTAAPPEPVLFVFDLDDTLIRYLRTPEREAGLVLPRQGDINGYRYRVLDGVPEMLQSILDGVPGARIAFFSGGERFRNVKILSELELPDGRTALKVATAVVSKEEIPIGPAAAPDAPNPPGLEIFNGHEKKDLRQFVKDGITLDRIILIDDNLAWAHGGQEKNFLWLGNRPGFHQVSLGEGPQSPEEFVRDRNKLARARGMIDRAIELSRSEGLPLREAFWRLQWSRDPASGQLRFNERLWTDVSLYREGVRHFRRVNPAYRFTPALEGPLAIECVRARLRELSPAL